MSIEHNHLCEIFYHPNCPRCKLNENAEALLIKAEEVRDIFGSDCQSWYELNKIIDKIRGKK